MDPRKREQVILVMLPAAILLLGYALFVHRGQQKEYRQGKERLAQLSQRAVTENAVLAGSTRVRFAERENDELQKQLQQTQDDIDQLCHGFGGPQQQFGVVEQITELLREHGVALVSQSTASEPRLSRHQKDVLQTIRERSTDGQLEYRELRLLGRYRNVQAFLQALGESPVFVLPVALELDTSESVSGIHSWRIVIVM